MNYRKLLGSDTLIALGTQLQELRGNVPLIYLVREACLHHWRSEISRLTGQPHKEALPPPVSAPPMTHPPTTSSTGDSPVSFLDNFENDLGL